MSKQHKNLTEDLGEIIRALADAWPNDRETVAVAGAKLEQVLSESEVESVQLKRLTDLAWQGIMHLYQKDDYFMTVKASTMQAVNVYREFIVNEGDIKVEEFESAYEHLEKALSGTAESADTVIELDEEAIDNLQSTSEEPASVASEEASATMDDLSAALMMMDADPDTEALHTLISLVESAGNGLSEDVLTHLNEVKTVVERLIAGEEVVDWMTEVTSYIEQAIQTQTDEEWESSTADATAPQEPAENSNKQTATDTAVEPQPAVEAAKKPEESDSDSDEEEIFHIPMDIELSMVSEFITECADLIELAEGALLELEDKPEDDELINTVFRAFHTIKGTSAFMGLDPVSEYTHSAENLLSMVREGELSFDRACADISLESIDVINKLLEVVEHAEPGDPLPRPPQYDPMIRVLLAIEKDKTPPAEALASERDTIAEIIQEEPGDVEIPELVDQTETAGNDKAGKSESESSVRVSVGRLDRLIDMVGELVIAHSVVAQDKAIPKDSELQKKVNHATKILRELQDTSLTLRMVPLKATFHKMNRLVRDLSRKAGKPVKFSTFGEDTEIDRNMVDIINEPLIHMIRNSLDHGIEEVDERKKTGKSEKANIYLRASQEGGKVVIEISDDGRGINKDKIYAKALEKGLVDPDKKMSDKEIYGLIFLPGFSSVEKVTDLSGRGVGMDVVRRSIEQLQGKVEVTSELGKGTTITIELPFTLAITDGMLVSVGDERFVVPTINIDMTFRAVEEDLFTVLGKNEQVSFRGKSVPVIRLHKLFNVQGATESLKEGTLLVIKNNNSRYALLVDEVIGQQQLVGKSINMIGKTNHISGGAILGDGRVGLILDTAALVE